jgi:hypothetical protein
MLIADGSVVGVVGRAVIEEKNLLYLIPYLFGNAIKCPVELVDSIVGDDKDANPLLLKCFFLKHLAFYEKGPTSCCSSLTENGDRGVDIKTNSARCESGALVASEIGGPLSYS